VSGDPGAPRPFVRPVPERLSVAGPAGTLETLADTPAGFDGQRAALVCHPHPLFGGTMDNKVVTTAARALQEAGFATVRFNFRGVGASAGEFDDGRGETADAAALADWAERRWPGARLTLAGFSFGAYVAYRLAGLRAVEQLITIAPPVKRFNFAKHPVPAVRWVVIQGDRDELVDIQSVLEWTRTATPPPQVRVVEGAEHFFHGRLNDLREAVLASLGP
jgi:uncharacterized protein